MIFLLGLMWVALGVYCLYVILFITGLSRLKKTSKKTSLSYCPSVSVVMAVRNESKNLNSLLEDLVAQDYPINKLEIIVADDRSTDGTWKIITSFTNEYLNFNGVQITKKSNKMTPKKHALSEAISIARGTIILSTDGDCRVPKTWVSSMVGEFENNTGVVAGFSSVETESRLFHLFQRIDFLSLMSANAGAMGVGFSWAGSGQNLAYKKSYFNQVDGFFPVANEVSGDDIYLIQSISQVGGGSFNPDPDGAVMTLPVDSLWQFINQRIRWASNSQKQYQSQIWFLVFLLSVYIVNVSLLLHVVLGVFTLTFILMWVFKVFLEGVIIYLGGWISKTPVSFPVFLLWSLVQIVYIPLMGLLGVSGRFSWKP